MHRRVTVKDVAKEVGMSHMTVVRALKNSPSVSEKTSEKVLAACKKLHYRPNLIASQLRDANLKSRIIAVIVPALHHSYYASFITHVEAECRKLNYHIMLYQLTLKQAVSATWNDLNFLLARHIDGLIIIPKFPRELTDRLKNEHVPMVFMDIKPEDPDLNFIGSEDFEGCQEITEYLLQLGHRKFAFIAGPEGHYSSGQRLAGCHAALAKKKLVPKVIYSSRMDLNAGYVSMNTLLKNGLDFTALVAANDYLAMGAMSACSKHNISIPDDLSVSGFAGVEESAFTVPPLTTMRQKLEDIGTEAFKMLLRMEQNPDTSPQNILFPVELIERESCRKI